MPLPVVTLWCQERLASANHRKWAIIIRWRARGCAPEYGKINESDLKSNFKRMKILKEIFSPMINIVLKCGSHFSSRVKMALFSPCSWKFPSPGLNCYATWHNTCKRDQKSAIDLIPPKAKWCDVVLKAKDHGSSNSLMRMQSGEWSNLVKRIDAQKRSLTGSHCSQIYGAHAG